MGGVTKVTSGIMSSLSRIRYEEQMQVFLTSDAHASTEIQDIIDHRPIGDREETFGVFLGVGGKRVERDTRATVEC